MKTNTLRYYSWAILWSIVILVLCNMRLPQDDTEGGFFFIGFDKLVHLGFFFVLAVLLFFGKIQLQRSFAFRSLTIFKVVAVCALLGGGVELLQWKVFTYRSAEWWDFGCDMLGAFMAVFSYVLLHKMNYDLKK